jgi:hypothetical protein
MMDRVEPDRPKLACDAMCGGLARWLRILGVDASYTPAIEDAQLVAHARNEGRVVLSSDGKLFERREFTTGVVRGLRMPVGLRRRAQVEWLVRELHIEPGFPRCAACNGELEIVSAAEVGDVVPARSLIWAAEFYRCRVCAHVFWKGTHWRRIDAVRAALEHSARPGDAIREGTGESEGREDS